MLTTFPAAYPILDTTSLERFGADPVTVAEAFLEGGATLLQFRHKAFWSRDTFAQAQQIAQLCRQGNASFVVNDRGDYTALLGAGLHLGQHDLPPADARRVIGGSAMLGLSTHNGAQMIAAQNEPADYLAFGPVFPTLSKERPDPATGIETLRAVRALTGKPLVAVGGITRDNAHLCWKAGANSVAVIGDLLPVSFSVSGFTSFSDTKRALRERMAEWQRLTRR